MSSRLRRLISTRVLLFSAQHSDQPQLEELLPHLLKKEQFTWLERVRDTLQPTLLHLQRHIWLKSCLSSLLASPPATIILAQGRYSKPYIQGRPLHFNVSHSNNFSLLAVSRWPIGVDVEEPSKPRHYLKIAQHWFHDDEYAQLQNLPHNQSQDLFYLLWTRKEAFAKVQGQAVSRIISQDRLAWPAGHHWYQARHTWFLDFKLDKKQICLCSRQRIHPLWFRS